MVVRFSLAPNDYGMFLCKRQVLLINKLKVLGLINVIEDNVSDGHLFLLTD